MKRKFLFVTGFLLTGTILAGYFYYSRLLAPNSTIPESVLAAEDALAMPGTFLISSVDLEYASRVNQALRGPLDPEPIYNPDNPDSILAIFHQNEIDLLELSDFGLGVYFFSEPEDTFGYAFLLSGSFPAADLARVISENFVTSQSDDGFLQIQIESERTCELGAPRAIDIREDRILIASPAIIANMTSRLDNNAPAGIDISQWRQYRLDKLWAAALLTPDQAPQAAPDGITRMVLTGATSDQPVESVYGSAQVQVTPQMGLRMELDIHAENTQWPAEKAQQFSSWLEESREQLAQLPTVAGLLDYLSVSADANILHSELLSDANIVDDIRKIPGEIFGMVFSSSDITISGQNQGTEEATISPEELPQFLPTASAADLTTYTDDVFSNERAVTGPFAVEITSITHSEDFEGLVEVTFEVHSANLVNAGDGKAGSFLVSAMEDGNGNNQINRETCGNQRSSDPTDLRVQNSNFYSGDNTWVKIMKAFGEKKVRLADGVSLTDIENIQGLIEYDLPTRVSISTLDAPLAGSVFEANGMRLYFKESTGSVDFDLSGNKNLLLDIRAKNANGDYLADAGGSNIFGSTGIDTVKKRFRGAVDSVEIVYADETETLEYPFRIDGLLPDFSVNLDDFSPDPFLVPPVTPGELGNVSSYDYPLDNIYGIDDMTMAASGPFLIFANPFENTWNNNLGASMDVYAPNAESLRDNLSGLTLVLTEIQTTSGDTLPYVYSGNLVMEQKQINQSYFLSDTTNVYLADESYQDINVAGVSGSLQIRLPVEVNTVQLDPFTLGNEIEAGGMHAAIVQLTDEEIIFNITGEIDNLVQISALGESGERLAVSTDLREKEDSTFGLSDDEIAAMENQPPVWEAEVKVHGQPTQLELITSESFDEYEYPFTLDFTAN